MPFEPQKFFIGLVDFFSVLLPGAVVAFLGKDWVAGRLVGQEAFPLEGLESWLIFFFASYLLGHFIFLVGTLLDEAFYDPLRRLTYWGQVRQLARGQKLSSSLWRKLASSDFFFGKRADDAVIAVERLKSSALEPLGAGRAVNAYQWAKARLTIEHPEGLAAVQRFEADSKFFRSLVVVLLALAGVAWRRQPTLAYICAGLVVPALWRYVDQRFKGTQQAYWLVLTMDSAKGRTPPLPSTGGGSHQPSHAGGVVYRKNRKIVEYLLVEASDNRLQLVLPKGHIEPGEESRVTAVREVEEETGCWARVQTWLGDERLGDSNSPLVRLYLMAAVGDSQEARALASRPAEARQPQWLDLNSAMTKALPETQSILERADKRRASQHPYR